MSDLSEHAKNIYASAERHEGQFLLRRRFRKSPWQEKDDVDRDYDACAELVSERLAYWLSGNKAPGIRLTGKPLS